MSCACHESFVGYNVLVRARADGLHWMDVYVLAKLDVIAAMLMLYLLAG